MPVYAAKVDTKPKEKKPRTEKQLAADARNAETRKRKREEAGEEDVKKKLEDQKAVLAEKKKVLAEKRKAKREEKKMDEVVEEAMSTKPPPKPPAVVVEKKLTTDVDKPPIWFESYVQAKAKEENKASEEKRPSKQVTIEARAESEKKWADPSTRKAVTRVNSHVDKMYSMMFGR